MAQQPEAAKTAGVGGKDDAEVVEVIIKDNGPHSYLHDYDIELPPIAEDMATDYPAHYHPPDPDDEDAAEEETEEGADIEMSPPSEEEATGENAKKYRDQVDSRSGDGDGVVDEANGYREEQGVSEGGFLQCFRACKWAPLANGRCRQRRR
eukprot:GHVU01197535.1.p1 GENE.GHVU01197535.1~~GHVU01197535.1.p1  ORF type:complete len:151 (+),score=32.75 GHVU01197535.1:197-649(+)